MVIKKMASQYGWYTFNYMILLFRCSLFRSTLYLCLGAKFGDISRSVASMWESMAESEKSIFKKKSEQDRGRFLREMAEYKNSKSAQQPAVVVQPKTAKSAKKVVAPTAEVTRLFGGTGSVMEDDSIRSTNTWEVTDNECVREGCPEVIVF